jgi:hypothetical protein
MSGRRDRSSPSLSALRGHPRRCQPCAAIPVAAAPRRALWRHPGAVGACGDKTSPQQPLCHVWASRQRHPRIGPPRRPVNQLLHRSPRSRSCTSTGRPTTPQRERDSPGRPSAPQHCSPYRYMYRNSAARMLTTPSLAYKRRGSPPAAGGGQGTTDSSHSHALRLPHNIGTRLNQTSGTCRPHLLSRFACSHPSTSTTVQAIQCPEHTAAGRTAPAGTRINQVSLVA